MELEKDTASIARELQWAGLDLKPDTLARFCETALVFGHYSWTTYIPVEEGQMRYDVKLNGKLGLQLVGFNACLYNYSGLTRESVVHSFGLDGISAQLALADWNSGKHEKLAGAILSSLPELLGTLPEGASTVATALFVKHWLQSPVEGLIPARNINDLSSHHFFKLQGTLQDFTARQAYNLLAGRSVQKFKQSAYNSDVVSANWKWLQDGKFTELASLYDLEGLLVRYRVKEYIEETPGSNLFMDLMNGEKVHCHLQGTSGDRPVFICAAPDIGDLRIFLEDGTALRSVMVHPERYAREMELRLRRKKSGRGLRP